MGPVLRLAAPEQVVADSWQIFRDSTAIETGDALPIDGDWLWPIALWRTQSETLKRLPNTGLYLEVDDEPDQLDHNAFDDMALIGINFDVFSDGRGLSSAVLLRNKLGYQGELRALGDVLPDMLDYLRRCGFDSCLLRKSEELQAAQRNLAVLDSYYQGSVIEPRPLFRRVSRAAKARGE